MQIDSNSKLIALTRGQFAIVDATDYEWLNQYKWYAVWHRRTKSYYAARAVRFLDKDGKRQTRLIYMHRELLGFVRRDGNKADHREGNSLDNRRLRLRPCTDTENNQNKKLSVANKSGYKGVCWDKYCGKWMAYIKINGRQKTLGRFKVKEEARDAYIAASIKNHGEFSRLQ